MFFLNCQSKFVRSTWAIGRCPGFSQARAERMSSDMRLTPGGRSCLFQKIYSPQARKYPSSYPPTLPVEFVPKRTVPNVREEPVHRRGKPSLVLEEERSPRPQGQMPEKATVPAIIFGNSKIMRVRFSGSAETSCFAERASK